MKIKSYKCEAQNSNIGIRILLSIILFSGAYPAFAQQLPDDFEEIKLYVGEPLALPSSNTKRIAIARPEVADVRSVATDEVVLEPKAPGVTSLFIWDDYGRHAYQLKVLSEDFSLVKERADNIIRELGLS